MNSPQTLRRFAEVLIVSLAPLSAFFRAALTSLGPIEPPDSAISRQKTEMNRWPWLQQVARRLPAWLVLASVALFLPTCAPAALARASAPLSPPPDTEGWYICALGNYFSDIFAAPDTMDSFRDMTAQFQQFVLSQYKSQAPSHAVSSCNRYLSQRLAQNALSNFNNGKNVLTGWKYGTTAAPAAAPGQPGAAAPPMAAAGSPPSPDQLRFCWVSETSPADPYNNAGRPAYFTAMFAADQDHAAAGGSLFAKYIEKKYSVPYHGPSYCSGGTTALQARIAYVKQHGGAAVMTDWTPDKHEALMAELAKNPPSPPPAAPVAKKTPPPPSAAQEAYEKAMAAQRPQSVSQAQLAAAAKTPAPGSSRAPATPAAAAPSAGTTGEKYMFCYSTGSPYRGTASSHYYVTQVFPAPAGNSHPQNAFGAYLHGQYQRESISGHYCSTPASMSVAESTRRSYIENQRKIPNRVVVELNWKPTS